jgi:mRNA interferase MazF
VAFPVRFLRPGGFDAQSLITVPHAKLIRPLGRLTAAQLSEVEARVCDWLGLPQSA